VKINDGLYLRFDYISLHKLIYTVVHKAYS